MSAPLMRGSRRRALQVFSASTTTAGLAAQPHARSADNSLQRFFPVLLDPLRLPTRSRLPRPPSSAGGAASCSRLAGLRLRDGDGEPDADDSLCDDDDDDAAAVASVSANGPGLKAVRGVPPACSEGRRAFEHPSWWWW